MILNILKKMYNKKYIKKSIMEEYIDLDKAILLELVFSFEDTSAFQERVEVLSLTKILFFFK